MTDFSALAHPTPPVPERCPRCGGSGQLRTGHGAYRSCLDCAARGILSAGPRTSR